MGCENHEERALGEAGRGLGVAEEERTLVMAAEMMRCDRSLGGSR